MIQFDVSPLSTSRIQALGIDSGSTTVKIAGLDQEGRLCWHLLEPAEPLVEKQVDHLLEAARQVLGSLEGVPMVATGYGRRLIPGADRQVTEISCHARGAFQELGHGGTLIDIGGQDSKVIRLNPQGKVLDFMMNDKCSAGTGRFLENTSHRLNVPLEHLGERALSSLEEVPISSTCTVFAESEVISLIAHGVPLNSILLGLHRSLIQRLVAMLRSVGLVPPLMLSGGVALNPAISKLLEDEIGEKVIVPPYPQLIGAQGAALIALDSL